MMENPFETLDRRLSKLEALLVEVLTHLREGAATAAPEIGGMDLAQAITRLSKARIYALVAARQIPHAKRGNKLYFTRADLLAWLTASQRDGHKT